MDGVWKGSRQTDTLTDLSRVRIKDIIGEGIEV